MKRIAFILCLAVASQAAISLKTIADIAGDGSVHAINVTAGTPARWIQVIAPSTNTSPVRFGDSLIGSSRGAWIAPGAGYMTPQLSCAPNEQANCMYDVSKHYYLVQSGDSVSITYAQ